jgi:hypothetical protein
MMTLISDTLSMHREGNGPRVESGCRMEDNIRMNLREIGWESVDIFLLSQDRDQWQVVNTVLNFRVPLNRVIP